MALPIPTVSPAHYGYEGVHDSSPLLTLVRKRLMLVFPQAQLKWSLWTSFSAALLTSPLPPQSSLCHSNLLSVNQIKLFCLFKTCQLFPIATSHGFFQGLTHPACACSMTSSPNPPTLPLCFIASGLGLGTHQAPSMSRAASLLPLSPWASHVYAKHVPFSELGWFLKCHLQESCLP